MSLTRGQSAFLFAQMSTEETDRAARQKAEEFSKKYPDSFAFRDWEDGERSFDQRLLEHRLETIAANCRELHETRRSLYTKGTFILPCPVVIPDIPRFREDRQQCLAALSQVQFPEPHTIHADLLSEEVVSFA